MFGSGLVDAPEVLVGEERWQDLDDRREHISMQVDHPVLVFVNHAR